VGAARVTKRRRLSLDEGVHPWEDSALSARRTDSAWVARTFQIF